MSTVEGYDLHVYCDQCDARNEFGGSTRAECYDQARRKGWAIDTRRRATTGVAGGFFARCPRHSGKTPNPLPLRSGERWVTLEELDAQMSVSTPRRPEEPNA